MWNTRLNRGGHICHFSENVNHQWKTNGFGWWLRLIKKKKTWRHNWRVQKKRIWINDWASGGSLVGKSCLTLAASWTVSHQFPLSWNFSGKNIGVCCHFLLQGIYPTQPKSNMVSHIAGRFFTKWVTREDMRTGITYMFDTNRPILSMTNMNWVNVTYCYFWYPFQRA